MRHPLQPLYSMDLFTNQRKAKCSKGFVVFSPQGRQNIISLTPSLAFQPLSSNLKSRVPPLPSWVFLVSKTISYIPAHSLERCSPKDFFLQSHQKLPRLVHFLLITDMIFIFQILNLNPGGRR